MEQIKRANRMYTNDSIFLKKSLSIPVMSDLDPCVNGLDLNLEDSAEDNAGSGSAQNGHTESSSEEKQDDGSDIVSDLTPEDFLKRLDGLISQSKEAAVKGCQDAERRYVCLPSLLACLLCLFRHSHSPCWCRDRGLKSCHLSYVCAEGLHSNMNFLILLTTPNTNQLMLLKSSTMTPFLMTPVLEISFPFINSLHWLFRTSLEKMLIPGNPLCCGQEVANKTSV